MRIDRMLGIIVLLLNRDRVSAKQLAEKFEVSVRTVYRDIDSINMAGIPIVTYPGNKGGFGIMPNYKLDRQVLSLEDMGSIISALKSVNASLGGEELDTVAEKILNLVPVDKVDHLKKRFDEFCIDFMPWGFKPKFKEYIKILQQAISDNLIVSFLYRNSKGEALTRNVEPMTLIFKGYAWYLYGYCLLRQDYRLFRISRMGYPEIQKKTFERRNKTYTEFMNVQIDQTNFINLVLKFSPLIKQKVEEYFDENISSICEDGSMVVSIRFPEDEWIYSTILSFGEFIEVLEPESVRNEIKAKTKRMTELYN